MNLFRVPARTVVHQVPAGTALDLSVVNGAHTHILRLERIFEREELVADQVIVHSGTQEITPGLRRLVERGWVVFQPDDRPGFLVAKQADVVTL